MPNPLFPQSSPGFVPVPSVYIDPPTPRWEYHTLEIDPREATIPDAAQMNTLGAEGWLLAGILQPTIDRHLVYYFVRAAR